MLGKTHMIVGAATGLAVCAAIHMTPTLVAIGAATVGALIPDIDHPNSKISRTNIFTRAISWITRKIILPVTAFILNVFSHLFKQMSIPFSSVKPSHRGPLTHSIIAVFVLSLFFIPILYISKTAFVFLIIGMLSHVFIDMLNPEGSPIAYPFTSKKISVLPGKLAITTGTKREEMVKIAGIVAIIVFGCMAFGLYLF